MSRPGSFGQRLYRGEVSYEFVGRWRRWAAISAIVIVAAVVGLAVNGLKLSIDFKGGTEFDVQKPGVTLSQAQADVATVPGLVNPTVQTAGNGTAKITLGSLSSAETEKLTGELSQAFKVPTSAVNTTQVGANWGGQVSQKALLALIIFLIAVAIYMWAMFEWKMALAAMVALLHDLVITVGVYALVGFQVSPATVTGLLTILGYSLYDTVVVFDKVRENTRDLKTTARSTYSKAANLAINQSLVRSINTSVVAVLPVAALLFVGAGLGAADVLKDLALALLVGIIAGTYSSIFIATPLLAQLKEREKDMRVLAGRVAARAASQAKQQATRRRQAPTDGQDGAEGPDPDGTQQTAAAAAGGTGGGRSTVNITLGGAVPVGAGSARSGEPGDRVQPAKARTRPKGRPSGRRRR